MLFLIFYFILFLAPYGFLWTFSFKKALIFSPHEQLHLYGLIKDYLKSDDDDSFKDIIRINKKWQNRHLLYLLSPMTAKFSFHLRPCSLSPSVGTFALFEE